MTRQRSLNIRILNVSVVPVALLSAFIAFRAEAQQSGKEQPSPKSSPAHMPAQASARAHGSPHLPLWGTGIPSSAPLTSPENKIAAPSATSMGSVSFNAAVPYDAGAPCVNSVAVADVNGDGKPDLLTANGCPVINNQGQAGSVSVMLGNGDGTFRSAVTYNSGGFGTVSVQVGDLNGDGNPDLLVANECSSEACPIGVIGVLLGNGNGTFQPAVTYNFEQPLSAVLADVNGDSKLDVVGAALCFPGCGGGLIGIFLGDGDGTFQPAVTYPSGGLQPWSVAVSDVNGDGKPDVLVANQCSDSFCTNGLLGVLIGYGDGTFQTPVTYSSGGQNSVSIAAADVNGDGMADLLVANVCFSSVDCLTGSVGILLGKGNGTFGAPVTYDSGAALALSLAVGDVNRDGKPDIVVAHCTRGTQTGYSCPGGDGVVGLLLGNGDGTFQPAVTYDSGGVWARSIAIADVNRDGRTDLLVANFGQNGGDGSVGVLLNTTKPATTTTFVSSLNPSIYGQKITWTATVTTTGSVTPTGTVSFTWSDGFRTFNIGSATLNSSGVATLTRSNLNADPYPLTAKYQGDANNLTSTSPILNQTVLQATSAATITSSPNPSILGQAVTFTAQITSPTVTPTGPVTFTTGKTGLGTAQLTRGKATLTISSLPAGSSVVTATFNGDSNIKGSSAVVTQIVQ